MSHARDYTIFGKHIRIHDATANLLSELDLYPRLETKSKPNIVIRFGDFSSSEPAVVNPAIHHSYAQAFIAQMGANRVCFSWQDTDNLNIYISKHTQQSLLRKWLWKIRNLQYTTVDEALGQAFHELVLVPSVYFDSDRFLIHASGVLNHENEVILLGGTGGVGKTSLELELCLQHGYRFVADDISVVSSDGLVSPNLAFPKIYGYNLVNTPSVAQKVFKDRSTLDHLHWRIHATRGLNRVRRRVSPLDLYGGYSQTDAPLSRYYILLREDRDDIQLEVIDAIQATKLTLLVMQAEYSIFHNQLLWHTYNRQLMGQSSDISLDLVLSRWQVLAQQVFERVSCYLIRIPINLQHEQFKHLVSDMIIKPDDYQKV